MEAGIKTGRTRKAIKSKKTSERTGPAAKVAGAIVPSTPTFVNAGEIMLGGMEVPRPGITALGLLLTVMRTAYEDYCRKSDEAEELERQAGLLDQEAAADALLPEETVAEFQVRLAIKLDAAKRLRERGSSLQGEAELDRDFVVAIATVVLPYQHPQLFHVTNDYTVKVICE